MIDLTRLALALAPIPEKTWGLPLDASKDGHHIDWLIQITSVFTGILFVITCVWMVWACVKHHKDHKADYDHGDSKHSVKVALALSAVIFFIVDGNLWVDSTIDVNERFWNFAHADSVPDRVAIEINGHQWAWDARYAGPDGKMATPDDAVVLNELVVPVDTPIVLQLASVDVIHSFYLPNFRVKMDAVPGAVNKLWFHPTKVGEYDIACAQHCGVNHYKMKALLRVVAKEDYKRWLARQSALSQKAYNPDDTASHWGWEWQEMD
jgi:cytochrome c oxidase subunit II